TSAEVSVFYRRRCWMLALLAAALPLTGCGKEEEIVRQEAPRVAKMQRLLGAIIPRDEKTWFVKLSGPEQQIEALKGSYDRFVHSIEFSKGRGEPSWTLPQGWTQESQDKLPEEVRKLRFATLRTGGDENLTLTVTSLDGADAGEIRPNIDRWRQQIGLR